MTLTGTRIGNIRVVEPLGQGGMGEIYVGFDEKLRRKVALKSIRRELRSQDPTIRARFLRETPIPVIGDRRSASRNGTNRSAVIGFPLPPQMSRKGAQS